MKHVNARKKFVDWTKKQLIGIDLKENLLNGKKPLERFYTGFHYPIWNSGDGIDFDDNDFEDYQEDDEIDNEAGKFVHKRKRYVPPSSVGFSFYIKGDNIKLRVYYNGVYFTSYEKNNWGHVKTWEKNKFSTDGEEVEFYPDGEKQYKIFNGRAKIDALWRTYNDGFLVTISISNQQQLDAKDNSNLTYIEENEKTIFEVKMKCIIETGEIANYPAKDKSLLTEEEREIELRYQKIKTYAIGHGVSVDWGKNLQGKMEIWIDFMPTVEVPHVTADTSVEDNNTLAFSFLKDCNEGNSKVFTYLENFIKNYEKWVFEQEIIANGANVDDKDIAKHIVANQQKALYRMKKGLDLLKSDINVRESFSIMNQAMLKQWVSHDQVNGVSKKPSEYKWRPFQLAFILLSLESLVNEESEDRDTLDLIWFPTGGGKTEAYLGLMVFLFVYRRLNYPSSSSGTVAIMRYTLKLLTTQQFFRANRVIFALELIRQKNAKKLGEEPFTTGLWVGSNNSPNKFKDACDKIEQNRMKDFPLTRCPWCNSEFTNKNFIVDYNNFSIKCNNQKCEYGAKKSTLPCNFVDEALYKNPPTLLIATVDKFARLAWEERASSFFGIKDNRPPELIIQDELHLITSSLGSIVGLYESGIDTVLKTKGMHAKYIASTATIKNARKQVRTLFARDTAIFPPPGLRYDDSYFAKIIPLNVKPGRLYVGFLSPLLTKQKSLEPLAGTLLAAPTVLFKDTPQYLDNYWTQVVYHGSLKSVMNSITLYKSGIKSKLEDLIKENLIAEIEDLKPGFTNTNELKTIQDFEKIEDPEIKNIVSKYLPVRELKVKQLTSQQEAQKNTLVFNLLAKERHDATSIDVALATNMISVGLDVPRLALMIINGQPLQTAEYIQASSRIGRGETPGIVFVNYYKTQARSLSHFENFKAYHNSFYRYVEPSSLTPYTYQARTRALHAALIIAIRHGHGGLLSNDTAVNFNENDRAISIIISEFKKRCENALNGNIESHIKVSEHIDKLIKAWQDEIINLGGKRNLKYSSISGNDKGSSYLLCRYEESNFQSDPPPWPTLNSMRNVDKTCLVKLED